MSDVYGDSDIRTANVKANCSRRSFSWTGWNVWAQDMGSIFIVWVLIKSDFHEIVFSRYLFSALRKFLAHATLTDSHRIIGMQMWWIWYRQTDRQTDRHTIWSHRHTNTDRNILYFYLNYQSSSIDLLMCAVGGHWWLIRKDKLLNGSRIWKLRRLVQQIPFSNSLIIH